MFKETRARIRQRMIPFAAAAAALNEGQAAMGERRVWEALAQGLDFSWKKTTLPILQTYAVSDLLRRPFISTNAWQRLLIRYHISP